MVKAEKRLGRKFTVDEVENGTMGSLLIESDFDTEKTVSRLSPLLDSLPTFFTVNIVHQLLINNCWRLNNLVSTMS